MAPNANASAQKTFRYRQVYEKTLPYKKRLFSSEFEQNEKVAKAPQCQKAFIPTPYEKPVTRNRGQRRTSGTDNKENQASPVNKTKPRRSSGPKPSPPAKRAKVEQKDVVGQTNTLYGEINDINVQKTGIARQTNAMMEQSIVTKGHTKTFPWQTKVSTGRTNVATGMNEHMNIFAGTQGMMDEKETAAINAKVAELIEAVNGQDASGEDEIVDKLVEVINIFSENEF